MSKAQTGVDDSSLHSTGEAGPSAGGQKGASQGFIQGRHWGQTRELTRAPIETPPREPGSNSHAQTT